MQTDEETKTAYINLGNGHEAIVDLEDLPRLSRSRWYTKKQRGGLYYAYRCVMINGARKRIPMHREVIGDIPDKMEVVHINGNGLDNRKSNLRVCSHRQNIQAGRKKRGRHLNSRVLTGKKAEKKWRARITNLTGQRLELGHFDSELDAAKAYDKAALELFGNFAQLNFPKPPKDADRLFPE